MVNNILLSIGWAVIGFCLASIYWTKPIQDKKDNELKQEIRAIRKKIVELNHNKQRTNRR